MDFLAEWACASIGGALRARRLVLGSPHSWLRPGSLELVVRADGSLWLRVLAPDVLTVRVNGARLEGPRRIGAADRVQVADADGHADDLVIRGLRADDTVPPGVIDVAGDVSPQARARLDRALELLAPGRDAHTLLDLAERWRGLGLQRAGRWLAARGFSRGALLATDHSREAVEALGRELALAFPPRLAWADALVAFLSAEGQLQPEPGALTARADGAAPLAASLPQPARLEPAKAHLALVGARVLGWLAAFEPGLAEAWATEVEVEAAPRALGESSAGVEQAMTPVAAVMAVRREPPSTPVAAVMAVRRAPAQRRASTGPDQLERQRGLVAEALAAAAGDLTEAERRLLEAAVAHPLGQDGRAVEDGEARWYCGFGVKVLLLVDHAMVPLPEETRWYLRQGRFERATRDEVLSLAEGSAAALERVWQASTTTPVMTRARLDARLAEGAAPPEALGLWREPWTDEEGAHLFVDLFERCLEVVRRPDGRVVQRTAWENPRLRSNPDEFWME